MRRRARWRSTPLLLALLLGPGAARAQQAERYSFEDDLVEASKQRPSTDGDAAGKLGSTRMRRANRMAAEILRRRMRARRPRDLKLVRRAAAADVVVVRGAYDRVQDVLRAVGVKHVVIPPRLVHRIPFMSFQTVMINCPGRLGGKALVRLRRFVRTGGYLVTTDWALRAVQTMFPGTIARGGRNTKNDVVGVTLHRHAHPVLRSAQTGTIKPRWWLESASYPIRVLDRRRVKVLISSAEMKKKYGHGAIAVAFRFDDGQVLHTTSHFYLQQARLRGRRERARGSAFARSAGLSAADVAALKKQGLDRLAVGALNSAYAMQQIIVNLLVQKSRANTKLFASHGHRAVRGFVLQGVSGGAGRGAAVRKGFILRVLERRGERVRVRDLFGRVGWTAARNLAHR